MADCKGSNTLMEKGCQLSKQFEMSDCGPLQRFLETMVEHNREEGILRLSQISGLEKNCSRF